MPHASWSMIHLLEYGQIFMSCTWHYLLLLGVTGLFNPLGSSTWKCTCAWSFFEKYVLTVQCIHNAWKWEYIMMIGNCHSRTSRTWPYLISSQVLYRCTLKTQFLFDNRYWHAVALRYKRNLLSCIWNILDTLKVMLSRTWQEFCRPMWWQCIDT